MKVFFTILYMYMDMAGIFVILIGSLYIDASLKVALTGQAISEKKIHEHYGNIHVYCPRVGSKSFQNHKSSVHLPIAFKLFPSNDILTIFPIQMHGRPTYVVRAVKYAKAIPGS